MSELSFGRVDLKQWTSGRVEVRLVNFSDRLNG